MSGVGVNVNSGYNQIDSIASPYSLNGQLPPEIALKEQALNRRQQIANLLLQRGTQSPQGQMAGRFYVPPSWSQGLAQLAQAGAGAYLTHQNDKSREHLAQQNKSMTAEAIQNYIQKQQGAPIMEEGPRPMGMGLRADTNEAQGPGAPVEMPTADVASQLIRSGQAEPGSGIMRGYAERAPGMWAEGPKPVTTTYTPEQVPVQGPGAPVNTGKLSTPSDIDKRKALVEAMTSGIPGLREFAAMQSKQEETDKQHAQQMEFMKGEKALDRDNRVAVAREQMGQALTMATLAGVNKADIERMREESAKAIARLEADTKKDLAGQGKTPPGYRSTADGKSLEAIPGGPADTKIQGVLNQDTSMLQNSVAGLDRMATTANQLLNHPGLPGIVGIRGKIPDVPGTDAADARALINTLKSQIGFGVLQEMRNNSKTGGALGSVSDAEGKRLENNLAAIDTTQSLDQIKKEIKEGIIDYVESAKGRLRDAYNMKHKSGEPVPMSPAGKGPSVGTVEGGYRFKGGDPAKAESWEKVQ